ncbi:MAG: hypothetical protein ACOX5Z_02450 [Desulfobulbus sp.]|jgi:hypothetical protein
MNAAISAPQALIDNLAAVLRAEAATPLALSGPVRPSRTDELPALTLSLPELDCAPPGVGGNPPGMVRGVMALQLSLDLAQPTTTFADGETVHLLADDRRSLHLPHQPLVSRHGDSPDTLGPEDCTVRIDSEALAVVREAPGAGQCRLRTAEGLLVFGEPLPPAGTLTIDYQLGQWAVSVSRCSGLLRIEVFAEDAPAVERLSNAVGRVLARPEPLLPGLIRLTPAAWGAIDRPVAPPDEAMRRTLQYRFTYEHQQPVIGTGGGPIRVIEVRSFGPGTGTVLPEQYSITQRGNHE